MKLKEIYNKIMEEQREKYLTEHDCRAEWDTLGYFYEDRDENKAWDSGREYIETEFNEVVDRINEDPEAREELRVLFKAHVDNKIKLKDLI